MIDDPKIAGEKTFLWGDEFKLLRQFLVNFEIIEIIDFGNKIIFEDATV